jgi:hypothetical protein
VPTVRYFQASPDEGTVAFGEPGGLRHFAKGSALKHRQNLTGKMPGILYVCVIVAPCCIRVMVRGIAPPPSLERAPITAARPPPFTVQGCQGDDPSRRRARTMPQGSLRFPCCQHLGHGVQRQGWSGCRSCQWSFQIGYQWVPVHGDNFSYIHAYRNFSTCTGTCWYISSEQASETLQKLNSMPFLGSTVFRIFVGASGGSEGVSGTRLSTPCSTMNGRQGSASL